MLVFGLSSVRLLLATSLLTYWFTNRKRWEEWILFSFENIVSCAPLTRLITLHESESCVFERYGYEIEMGQKKNFSASFVNSVGRLSTKECYRGREGHVLLQEMGNDSIYFSRICVPLLRSF